MRGKSFAMVFQEPMTVLNRIMRVGSQVEEVLERHIVMGSAERKAGVLELFRGALLPDVEVIYSAYPLQLSMQAQILRRSRLGGSTTTSIDPVAHPVI